MPILTMSIRCLFIPLLAVAVLLTGCGGAAVPQEHFYRLPVETPAALAAPALDGVLLVERFAADAVISQRPVAFSEQPTGHDLKQYHYHLWADAPPKLLQQTTVDYLSDRGVARQVLTADARVLADYLLKARIKNLEHLRGKAPKVNLRIEFALTRLNDNTLLWSRGFGEIGAAGDASVGGAIRGMGESYQAILEQLVKRIEAGE